MNISKIFSIRFHMAHDDRIQGNGRQYPLSGMSHYIIRNVQQADLTQVITQLNEKGYMIDMIGPSNYDDLDIP